MTQCLLLGLLLVGAATAAAIGAADTSIKRVFVLHRHGARTPLGVDAKTRWTCAPPHCELSLSGRHQCRSLGRHLRELYSELLPIEFDPERIDVEATSTDRTKVSARELVQGMFPDAEVDVRCRHEHSHEDMLMSWWESWPGFAITQRADKVTKGLEGWLQDMVSKPQMERMAHGLHLGSYCDVFGPVACGLKAAEDIVCNASNTGQVDPHVWPLRHKLLKLRLLFHSRVAGWYGASRAYDRHVGAFGYPLAVAALDALLDTNTRYSVLIRGGHDWNLLAMYAALGSWTEATESDETWAVDFAEALLLELHESEAGKLFIKARRTATTQEFNANFTFATVSRETGIRCQSEDGALSWSTDLDMGCPVADVRRFLSTARPRVSQPECFLGDSHALGSDFGGCGPENQKRTCALYRERCASVAREAGEL